MTTIDIRGEQFLVNGMPANDGLELDGIPLDGLLLNSRMINGIFDDLNPASRHMWAYPDTGVWDAERNVSEFVAAMAEWRRSGLDAFTIGVQGGSPQGYSKVQPWDSGGFDHDGAFRPQFRERLRRILDEADRVGLIAIVDLFYQGQEMRLDDDAAVIRATREVVEFILEGGWLGVMIEIANECNIPWEYHKNTIMSSARVHELIRLVKSIERDGRRLLVSSSFVPIGALTTPEVLAEADFILLHGNGEETPGRLAEMVAEVRSTEGWTPKPIMFNEDDHFAFDHSDNHMRTALRAGAGWGYFDPGSITVWPPKPTIGNYHDGFQAVPIDWAISSDMKRSFFGAIGAKAPRG